MGQRNFQPRHRKAPGRTFNHRKDWVALYDGDWDRYRAKYLQVNKRCYACGLQSEVVDHLVPHQGDKTLFKKLDNHIPLCSKCHNRVTALFDKRHRPGYSIDPKLTWLSEMRSHKDISFKVKVMPSYP